jgi:hypothetical protein
MKSGSQVKRGYRADGLGFLLEALFADRITRKLFRQDFEGNDALQPRVSGPVHLSHPDCAERRDNLIWSELLTWS